MLLIGNHNFLAHRVITSKYKRYCLKCTTVVQNCGSVVKPLVIFSQDQAYHLSHLSVDQTGIVQRIVLSSNEAPTFQVCIAGGMLGEGESLASHLPRLYIRAKTMSPAMQAGRVSWRTELRKNLVA